MAKGGVYVIRNKITKRIYVGETYDFDARWFGSGIHKGHLQTLSTGPPTHSNYLMCYDAICHGPQSFEFIPIEEVKWRGSVGLTACFREIREEYWIDRLGATAAGGGYNINLASYKFSPTALESGKQFRERVYVLHGFEYSGHVPMRKRPGWWMRLVWMVRRWRLLA